MKEKSLKADYALMKVACLKLRPQMDFIFILILTNTLVDAIGSNITKKLRFTQLPKTKPVINNKYF